MHMLEVFDRDRHKIGILENAFNVVETERLNTLNTISFSLPTEDPKNELCKGLNLVRWGSGELYRIVKRRDDEEHRDTSLYEAEHVAALLLNTSMFGYTVIGNIGIYTKDVLEFILSKQDDWVLDRCDFARQFEYGWEQENLYSALLSVPNRFVDKYKIEYDTTRYPYKVSLIRLDENAEPAAYVRRGFNRIRLTKQIEWTKIVTRLYPLGGGEGINQISITDINNGVPYIEAPRENIDRYGIIEHIWTDRRYTNDQSLLEAARAMLNELQEPYIEYSCDFNADNVKLGDIVEIVGESRDFVVEIQTRHSENDMKYYKIANKPYDVASALADVQDRQRIEMVYSQGATQIYADSMAENADTSNPAELRFFIVENMPIINAIKCKIRLSAFRTHGSTTNSGGSVQTSSSGGGATTSSGGGTSGSTESGGYSQQSSGQTTSGASSRSSSDTASDPSGRISDSIYSEGSLGIASIQTGSTNSHTHGMAQHRHRSYMQTHSHDISHTHTVAGVTITVPSHSHNFNVPVHSHNAPTHTHSLDTVHTHSVQPGINYFGSGSGFTLFINGTNRGFFDTTDIELDITQYFIQDGKIPRGTWHTIGVLPNALSRVEVSYNLQGFIQSRGGGTY